MFDVVLMKPFTRKKHGKFALGMIRRQITIFAAHGLVGGDHEIPLGLCLENGRGKRFIRFFKHQRVRRLGTTQFVSKNLKGAQRLRILFSVKERSIIIRPRDVPGHVANHVLARLTGRQIFESNR